jgi:AcrR family transcriptional regulator
VQKPLQLAGESADPRAVRTRDQITFALLDLVREKSYDDITVQDITQRARMSRTTFYAHFQDRDDIALRLSVLFGEYLGRQLRWEKAASRYRFPLAPLLEHMLDILSLYEALSRARRIDDLLKIFRISMTSGFERRIEATRRQATESNRRSVSMGAIKVPTPLLAQHIAGTIVQLLAWWMDHHCPSAPESVEQDFHRLIAGLR